MFCTILRLFSSGSRGLKAAGVQESDRAREQWVAAVYASLFLGVEGVGVSEGSW